MQNIRDLLAKQRLLTYRVFERNRDRAALLGLFVRPETNKLFLRLRSARLAILFVSVSALVGIGCDGASSDVEAGPELVFDTLELLATRDLDFRASPTIVVWQDGGNLLLVDDDEKQLVGMDDSLLPTWRVGGEGGGPGEFGLIADVRINSGEIFVVDGLLKRLTRFTASGRVITTHDLQIPYRLGQILGFRGDSLILKWEDFSGVDGAGVGVFDLRLETYETLFTIGEVDSGLVRRHETGFVQMAIAMGELQGQTLRMAQGVAPQLRVVEVSLAGNVSSEFEFSGMQPFEYTDVEKENMRAMFRRLGGERGIPEDVMMKGLPRVFSRPKPLFLTRGIIVDHQKHHIWVVAANGDAPGTKVNVFRGDGTRIGGIILRDSVSTVAIRDGFVAALAAYSAGPLEGLQKLDVYRLPEEMFR